MRISRSRKIWFNSILFEWSNYRKCFGHVQILGTDMSANMWEVTVEHARTCENLLRKHIVSYWERKNALMKAGGYWQSKNALMKGGERFELLEEEERFYDTWEFL